MKIKNKVGATNQQYQFIISKSNLKGKPDNQLKKA